MNRFQIQREIATVGPEILGFLGGFPIANSFLLSLVIVVLVAVMGFVVVKTFGLLPGKFQNVVEVMYEHIVDLIQEIVGTRTIAQKVVPLVAALFVYIGIANIIGLIPGVTSFTYDGSPLLRTPTSDFNTTVGLALGMVLLIQFVSIKDHGILGYIGRFIKIKEVVQGFRKGIKDGFMAIVDFFIGLLDIISEGAKVISLSFRLFGNMFAGEVLAVLLLSAFAFLLPALWLSLNLLFAVVQAIVFGSLAAAYYGLALKEEDGGSS